MLLDKIPPARRIDIGKRAGVTAGLLGVLCILAELCFMFPHILVSNDARPHYLEHIVLLRSVLHFAIIITFVLGAVSVLLIKSKTYGLASIGLAMIAVLMGGSSVEPVTHEPRAFSAGLDYFVLELLILGLLFIPMERLWSLHPDQKIFRTGWQTDLKHFFVSHAGVQLISFATMIPVQVALAWAIRFDFQQKVAAQPLVLQFFEIVVVADLAEYVVHRAFHTVPWLWRFHAVHHSAQAMDWLAGSRLHLLDIVVTRGLSFVPLYLLGFSPPALYGYLVFVSFHAVFIHTNIRFRFKPIEWLVVTPRFHHWHHADAPEAIDTNFAIHLPVIDRLFGTCYFPDGRWPEAYGISGAPVPDGWLPQLTWPFRRPRPVVH